MLKDNLNYFENAGITNLFVHVKLSNKNNESPIFSKLYGTNNKEQEKHFGGMLKSFLKIDKLVN